MYKLFIPLALMLTPNACIKEEPPTFPTCIEDPSHPQCDLPPGFVDGIPVGEED